MAEPGGVWAAAAMALRGFRSIPSRPDRQASAHGPAMDGTQQVALAARDVEDGDDAIGRQALSSAIDPVQGGTMGESDPVHGRQVMQTAIIVRTRQGRVVHQLR